MNKKSYDGKEYLRFKVENALVYPIVTSQTEFLVVYQDKTYKLRCESPFKRYEWLMCMNEYTKNLTEDL